MKNTLIRIAKSKKIWAIQLRNTDHLNWTNIELFDTLNFVWDDVKIGNLTKREDITIAVSQRNPNYSVEKIKNITSSIYNLLKIEVGDIVLGVEGEMNLKKIGTVSHKDKFNFMYDMELSIDWLDNFKPIYSHRPIFNNAIDIDKLTTGVINKLKLDLDFEEDEWIVKETMKSYSVIEANYMKYTGEEIFEIKRDKIKEDTGGLVKLFFGTNRTKNNTTDLNNYFGIEQNELKYGICEVSIPRGHIQGKIEKPNLIIRLFNLNENIEKHVMLTNIEEKNEQEFIDELTNTLEQSAESSALIFVHGYNTSFSDAAKRAAQIAYDIPFKGFAGFFSWPSAGNPLYYFGDIENADASIPAFEQFIEKIILLTNVEKLHIIAHSMGNRLLTFTLNHLSNKVSLREKLGKLHQIILAAPDIDQNVFRNTILPHFKNIGNRRTLYALDKDVALNASEFFRNGYLRLGDTGESIFVDDGIDSIDVSTIKTGIWSHSYVFETKELLTDLYFVLNQGLEPNNRRLKARNKDSYIYWMFPK